MTTTTRPKGNRYQHLDQLDLAHPMPCPFCGSWPLAHVQDSWARVHCTALCDVQPGAATKVHADSYSAQAEAMATTIDTWNTRATMPA